MQNVAVLFVCTGNICRSPTAEDVFRALLLKHGLQDKVRTDSAGTQDFHAGAPPDADVPDPYSGREEGFEQVLDMAEAASRGLIDHVRGHLGCVST